MRFRREVIVVSGVVLMVLYGSGSGGGDGSALIGPMGCEAAQTTAQPSPKHKRSFTDNLHSGIKLASSIFGLDATTSEVANLVAKAFAKPATANQRADGDTGRQSSPDAGATPFGSMAPPGMIITNLLRMFGLDGSKIGAMAVNGIILIAQMVSEGMYVLGLYMQQNLYDWWVILEYVWRRVREAQRGTVVQTVVGGGY